MTRNEQIADVLRVEGIMAQGYGMNPKIVMRDKRLTPEAKCIYSYISSFAGGGNQAFPSRDIMLDELGMSQKRYYRHLQLLLDCNYLRVERTKAEGNLFGKNIYTIVALPDAAPVEKKETKPNTQVRPADKIAALASDRKVDQKSDSVPAEKKRPAEPTKKASRRTALQELREQLDIDNLAAQHGEAEVEEIFLAVEDMATSEQIAIGKTVKDKEAISNILERLTPDHIRLVIHAVGKKQKLINRKGYIQACVMNSIFNINTLKAETKASPQDQEEQKKKEKEQQIKEACQKNPEFARVNGQIKEMMSKISKAILNRDELLVAKLKVQLAELEQVQKACAEKTGLRDCM